MKWFYDDIKNFLQQTNNWPCPTFSYPSLEDTLH